MHLVHMEGHDAVYLCLHTQRVPLEEYTRSAREDAEGMRQSREGD